jgi:tetratricopeptide (TPR) repeat protein
MILPLELRHDERCAETAVGWFLSGNFAERWLSELVRCGLANAGTRLFAIPRSPADRTPVGLLVLPDGDSPSPGMLSGLPCRVIAGRLYLPADAALLPPLTESEVRDLCALPVVFYHPAYGLSGFDEESTLRVWDLLELPEERLEDWNFARHGEPPLPTLSSIVFAQPPTIEDVFGDAPSEIGTDPIKDLPPAPEEPKEDLLGKSGRNLKRLFAKGVAGIAGSLPHTAGQRTWLNDVEDWAHRQLQGVNKQLDRIRNKEIHRLLHMLKTDPEAGLRHAISMNQFAHRGRARPGARLGQRLPNFDPSRLGGGPADFWSVPFDVQEELRRLYREMANRELQLGRYRRAAYIYAELLGDLLSAANTLRQGRFYREAALLYEEHLGNPLEATRCLAEGGFLAEAIERYEKQGRWLEAAELYERMGNHTAAVAAVRRVVDALIAQDDIVGAAKLLDERLHEPDEAVKLLLNAWPASRQAARCLKVAFQMLARLGHHETALDRIVQLSREPVRRALALPLLSALEEPAIQYPDERVRRHAADFSRVIVARQLKQEMLSVEEAGNLVNYLVRIAPEDRLLARDANRHIAERRAAENRKRRITPLPIAGVKPTIVRRFNLPPDHTWLDLKSEGPWFFAVGLRESDVVLLRGIWDGVYHAVTWRYPVEAIKEQLVFAPTGQRGKAIALATGTGPPFDEKSFAASDLFFSQSCVVSTPTWIPPGVHFAFAEDNAWTAHLASERAILSCYDKQGTLQRTLDVTEELLRETDRRPITRLCLVAQSYGIAITIGNRLVLTRGEGGTLSMELPGQVIGMRPTLPHTRQGLAVFLEHGAVLHWLGSSEFVELDRDIHCPFGAFVQRGPIVLVSSSHGMLLEVDTEDVRGVTRFDLSNENPVAVSAIDAPGQFAVLTKKGEMVIYQVAR